ncbi:MAG: glucose-1-phosphate cytidylyltransferase [Flavobacteriaceae bacterium]|nr:glucose-1-phosphate cytidylyltransferase [Flavobacteriaceae bacterium]
MKVVLLAGGLGTRFSEETYNKPKPMIEIGGMPMLWHIMKIYSSYGLNDFIICCGYKGYVIKEYFSNYSLHNSDVTFDLRNSSLHIHSDKSEPWKITLVDTGLNTMTGGRLKRLKDYFTDSSNFCLTYGDGLSDVNISDLINFHKSHGKLVSLTAVTPPARFGALDIDESNTVKTFLEKPKGDGTKINGGYFVMSPKVLDYIDGDDISLEGSPLSQLASENNLKAFNHDGFWQPVDTLREKNLLETLWTENKAPWKVW